MVSGQRLVVRITRPLKILVIFLFAFFFFAACISTASNRRNFVIAESKSYEASLFRQNCAICHGQEANGKEMNGAIIPSLRYGDAAKKTEEEIYLQIKEGKLPMPSFKDQLSEKEIRQMADFIMYDLQSRERQKEENKKVN